MYHDEWLSHTCGNIGFLSLNLFRTVIKEHVGQVLSRRSRACDSVPNENLGSIFLDPEIVYCSMLSGYPQLLTTKPSLNYFQRPNRIFLDALVSGRVMF